MGFPAQQDDRLPEFLAAECIGEACPNFTGEPCADTEMEWLSAGGPTEGRDTSRPPLRNEATYIIYGQRCLAGVEPKLVAQRVEIYQPEEVDGLALVAITGAYGDMPVTIVGAEGINQIDTIVSSD